MKKIHISIFLIITVLILTSCSQIKYSDSEGSFTQTDSGSIEENFVSKSDEGFFVTIDFELKSGKVNWEITDPKGEITFKGYVVYENGKVYKELLNAPKYFPSQRLNNKTEAVDTTDAAGNNIHVPDFNMLSYYSNPLTGEYKLYITPENAEGSYKVSWSDKLIRK